MGTMTMPLRGAHSSSASSSAMEDVGVRWWDRHFSSFGERIPFKSLFFPLLLKLGGETQQTSPLSQMSEQLSLDELTTLVKFCVAENAWKHGFVTKRDVCINMHFARIVMVSLTLFLHTVSLLRGAIWTFRALRLQGASTIYLSMHATGITGGTRWLGAYMRVHCFVGGELFLREPRIGAVVPWRCRSR